MNMKFQLIWEIEFSIFLQDDYVHLSNNLLHKKGSLIF